MLVRTWNVFHGNADPPERRAYLEEMVRLVCSDRPHVVCLQELPVWSLARLGGWSSMTVVADVAARPLLRPLPGAAEIGRVLTELHHGLFRSAFTGQANAMLLAPNLRVVEHRCEVVSPPRTERRVCQALRVDRDGGTILLGNLHVTGSRDKRIPAEQARRATAFLETLRAEGEPVVLAGDFNLTAAELSAVGELSGATPHGVDHVLVSGVEAGAPVRWPEHRRRIDGRLLSDHAPVERELT
jgi:endonuclease/exonuclease/phosphatase family metal-dependent hydrolase